MNLWCQSFDRNSAKVKICPLSLHLLFCYFPCWYVTWAQILKLQWHFGILSSHQKVQGPKDKIISGFAIPLFAPNKHSDLIYRAKLTFMPSDMIRDMSWKSKVSQHITQEATFILQISLIQDLWNRKGISKRSDLAWFLWLARLVHWRTGYIWQKKYQRSILIETNILAFCMMSLRSL